MNLFSKCLIFFLKISLTLALIPDFAGAATTSMARPKAVKKRVRPQGSMSRASIPVSLVWQIIRSQGPSAKMGTVAESFGADGTLVPKTASTWGLSLLGTEIPVSIVPGRLGVDGLVFAERNVLLKALGAYPAAQDGEGLTDASQTQTGDPQDHEGVQLVLAWSPQRTMETIYRSTEDDLYLVKMGIVVSMLPK